MAVILQHNSYGKSAVRLTKVVRTDSWHDLFEFSVNIQLQGEFAASYTVGDNTNIVATDSMKNTVYVLAKENSFDSPEGFALLLARHFKNSYSQVKAVRIEVEQTRWDRISNGGRSHPHAFVRGGSEVRTACVEITAERSEPLVTGGVRGLQVLKTTHSEFTNFVADRFRTLKDATDRIFATVIEASWAYLPGKIDFNPAFVSARDQMLSVFASHYSLAVQQTLLAMGEAILESCPSIRSIELKMPNQHRIPFNLTPFGHQNENEIFVPTDEPFGLITGSIVRK